jgi:hypothetical protein
MYEARTTGKAVGSSSAGADGRGWGQMTERALIGGAPIRAVASASRAPFGEGATTSLGRALSPIKARHRVLNNHHRDQGVSLEVAIDSR